MKLMIVALLSIMCLTSKAQLINPTTDTIKWEYTYVENVLNGDKLNKKGSITSYGDKQYIWEQDGHNISYVIESSSSKSSWQSVADDGNLESSATCNGINGAVTIRRSRNQITIELNFEQSGKLLPHLILTVASFSKI